MEGYRERDLLVHHSFHTPNSCIFCATRFLVRPRLEGGPKPCQILSVL